MSFTSVSAVSVVTLVLSLHVASSANTCKCPILEAYVPTNFDFDAGMLPIASTIFDKTWNSWTPVATLVDLPAGVITYKGDNQIPDFVVGLNTETEWVVRIQAKINIPTTGEYDFRARADDGFLLYIDKTLIIDNDGEHWAQTRSKNNLQLTAGKHDVVIGFYNKLKESTLEMEWTPTPTAGREDMQSSTLLHLMTCPCPPTCDDIDGSGSDFASCVAGTNHLKDVLTVTCATSTCAVSDCCEANPTCNDIDGSGADFSSCVAGTNHLKDVLTGTCATDTCVVSDCCDASSSNNKTPASSSDVIVPASCNTGVVNAAGDGCDATCSSGAVNAASDGCDATCSSGAVNAAGDGCVDAAAIFAAPGELATAGTFTPSDKSGGQNAGGAVVVILLLLLTLLWLALFLAHKEGIIALPPALVAYCCCGFGLGKRSGGCIAGGIMVYDDDKDNNLHCNCFCTRGPKAKDDVVKKSKDDSGKEDRSTKEDDVVVTVN